MNARELTRLGLSEEAQELATPCIQAALETGWTRGVLREHLRVLIASPASFHSDAIFGELARFLAPPETTGFQERDLGEWLDLSGNPLAACQLAEARRLLITVAGALLPDGQAGLGLPVGGVLATRGAVIPRAVGRDIGCRMHLSVLVAPRHGRESLADVLTETTVFGLQAQHGQPVEHPVMDRDWSLCDSTRRLKGTASRQLGTSGTGNHFVEFGRFRAMDESLGLPSGRQFLALFSHSGSRNVGTLVAKEFHNEARVLTRLPRELRAWPWLPLATEAGHRYWAAMDLMLDYAAASHEVLHERIRARMDAEIRFAHSCAHNLATIENDLVIHRKGAIRLGAGELGIIAGTCAHPSYLVRGKGAPQVLDSASHGAGRVLSRGAARHRFDFARRAKLLKATGVRVLSSGRDELPQVYRDIEEVIRAQLDHLDVVGVFHPRVVRMAPEGELAED